MYLLPKNFGCLIGDKPHFYITIRKQWKLKKNYTWFLGIFQVYWNVRQVFFNHLHIIKVGITVYMPHCLQQLVPLQPWVEAGEPWFVCPDVQQSKMKESLTACLSHVDRAHVITMFSSIGNLLTALSHSVSLCSLGSCQRCLSCTVKAVSSWVRAPWLCLWRPWLDPVCWDKSLLQHQPRCAHCWRSAAGTARPTAA